MTVLIVTLAFVGFWYLAVGLMCHLILPERLSFRKIPIWFKYYLDDLYGDGYETRPDWRK